MEIMNLPSILRMIVNALTKPKQRIPIQQLPPGGLLDIGGGGEGIIAQAGGSRVVAVDKLISEIHEARDRAPGTPWMVADATRLPFRGNCFDSATAFFSCMYMSGAVKEGVFRETRRVLKHGGEFWIWDARMARKSNVFAIRLQVDVRGTRTINTTYGVKAKDQSAASICAQLEEAGFEPELVTDRQHWFSIKARRV
jgi:ubiquinone/menaquinone biosynthesis C-methylase UbiE